MSDFAFNDVAERVPSTPFAYPEGEPEPDDERIRQEVIARLLHFLTDGARGPETVGRRCLLLRHLIDPEGSQRRLAKKLRVAESNLSRSVKRLRRELRGLSA